MKKLLTITSAIAAVLLAGGTLSALAQTSVGVKFVSASGSGSYGYGVGASSPDTLAPTDSAGVPGFAQVNWNNLGRFGDSAGISSWAGPVVVLTNSAGVATSLSIEWNSDYTASSGSSDSTPNGRLMDGYLGSWNGNTPASALGNSVYNSSDNNYPLAYVGGLQAWYLAQGAIGYKVVLYVGGNPGWQTGQGYIESVTGDPFSNTMVEGSALTPPLWTVVNATYSGTFMAITSTNSGSPNYGSGYMVFSGLTNDAVLLRAENWLGLSGFQIIPVFASQASIGVHFVNNGTNGLQNGSPDALSPATTAGVNGYAQKNWNNFGPDGDSVGNWGWATWVNGGPGSPVVLHDGSGAPTSLQISWGSAGNGSTGTATNLATAGTPNGDLMDGFITTWNGSTPSLLTNSGAVYFSDSSQEPLASIGGLNSWLAGYPGAVGYSVVLYYSGINYFGNVEGYVNAATGDIVSGTLTEVGAAAPPVFGQSGTFAGTFVQATGANSGSSTAGANYMVFTGLTNDTIVIHEHMLGYQGVWNGFQIVPVFPNLPSIGVHFGNAGGTGYADGSSTDLIAPGETAGITGYAQGNWNNLGASGDSGMVTLNDGTGAATSLSIMWASAGHGSTGTGAGLGTPDGKMMDGYLGSYSPGAATALGSSVYNNSANNNPLAYVGGLQAWYQGLGAAGYNVVLYTTGGNGWETAEGFLESVTSGDPFSNNMVEGDVLRPPLLEVDNANYSGSYVSTSGTSTASPSYGANYMMFYGLTNDAVLIRLQDIAGFGAGLNGFQIIPVISLPAVVSPVVTINNTNFGGGTNIVSWSAGTLQTATNILGPWTYNYTPSPVTDTMTNDAKFYRVWVQP